MIKFFYKTTELIGSSCVKTPGRSSAILNQENDDKYCIIWSILTYIHPVADSRNGHRTRVSIYRQFFNELMIDGFDFINGFKCSDVHEFEKPNNLLINLI